VLKLNVDSFQLEETKSRLQRAAFDSFQLVREFLSPKNQLRTGLFLRVFVSDNPLAGMKDYHELLASQVGFQADYYKWSGYQNLSHEKALRVMKNYVLFGHETSFESQNPSSGEYQGAILLHPVDDPLMGDNLSIVISSSGLPAMGDETVDLLIAGLMGWGTPTDYKNIAKMTGNSLFFQAMP
jgi:hypothetical protein